MWPALVSLGNIKITVLGISLGVAFVWASFQIWRKMREDYPEEDVLTLTIFLAVLSLLSFVGWRWWSLGGGLLVPALGLWAWTKRHGWNFWEWIDGVGPVSLAVGIIACFGWGIGQLMGVVTLLVGILVLAWISGRYRRFRWYKSGKVGFVGVASIFWWMLSWILIAKWRTSAVYWGGLALEQWVALWVMIACIITLYLRGGRRATHDLRKLRSVQLKKPWQKQKNQV